MRTALDDGELNLPDGMPLVWVARRLGIEMKDRVYGPDLMIASMEAGRSVGARHYLHGGTAEVLALLIAELRCRVPGVEIVGSDAPPFRAPTAAEDLALARRIDDLGADVVWVGLGTPKQDLAIHRYAKLSPATFVGVGAAFDFIAGVKAQAPAWMQDRGLEWLFRLGHEPGRLWKRYLIGNTRFVAALVRERPTLDLPR